VTHPTAVLLRDAVHQHRALSSEGLQERLFTLLFRGMVYTQVWEDPRADLEGLQLTPDSRVCMIASGGCNALSYLTAEPAAITAVDLNRSHIHLTRLKLAALEHLPTHEDFFRFCGAGDDENLIRYRRHLRPHLDEEARRFWEGRSWIRRRLGRTRVHCFSRNLHRYGVSGAFIRLAHLLSRLHGRDPTELLHARSLAEQEEIFTRRFQPLLEKPHVRWLLRMPWFLFGVGIPPRQREALLAGCEGDVARICLERVRRLACEFPVADNYFAWLAFGGRYDEEHRQGVPEYLREEHHERLRRQIHKVRTAVGSVTAYLRDCPPASLDRYVFLDAQDWMSPDEIVDLWTEVARTGRPGSRILYRTAARPSPVEPVLPAHLASRFSYDAELSRRVHARDRSAIYGGVHIHVLDR
jgi:S-adenosylmethionine-diacylglycerol 3-amino-3-carboxypropyl transferase